MKLLIYTHEFPPFLGGLATTSHKLAKGIRESGLEVVVLAPSYSSKDIEVDENLPCRVIRVPYISKKWLKAIPFADIALGQRHLTKTLSQEKPDAVLFITEEAEAAGGNLMSYKFSPLVRIAGSGITTCFYGNKFIKKLMCLICVKITEELRFLFNECFPFIKCRIKTRFKKRLVCICHLFDYLHKMAPPFNF